MTTHFNVTDTPWPLLIGGEAVAAESGRSFAAMNPSTGAELARFADAGEADADRAVAAARHAFETTWGTLTPKARSRHLMRFADAIRGSAEDFAIAETMDVGRPISITTTEMEGLAESVEYYAGILLGLSGETLNVSDPTLADFTLREPIGICGLITPWNYPALLAVLKIAPALAAGNNRGAEALGGHAAVVGAAGRMRAGGGSAARHAERDPWPGRAGKAAGDASGCGQDFLHRGHRSTQRKVPRGRPDEERLTEDIIELARQYGRYALPGR